MKLYYIKESNHYVYVVAENVQEAMTITRYSPSDVSEIRLVSSNVLFKDPIDRMDEYRDGCKTQLKKELQEVIDNFNY